MPGLLPELTSALIVEDERRHVIALTVALQGLCVVERASSVTAALGMLAAGRYRLLICDWHLNEQTGGCVIEHARRLSPRPVIVGYSGDEQVRELALAAGADHFVLKQMGSAETLRGLVAQIADSC